MKKNNFAIVSIVKDTPDYLLKIWIEHHFQIGVNDIYILIDEGSKPLYRDDRVHYVQITTFIKRFFRKNVDKWMINKIYDKYNWIVCINDNDFIHLDVNELDKHITEKSVLLPYKNTYKFMGDESFAKPIINTNLNNEKLEGKELENAYIDRHIVHSFSEWVEECFDIESTHKELTYSNYYRGHRFYDYFDYHNITDKFNPHDVYNMLKNINRLDVYKKQNFEFKIPSDKEKKFCAVAMVVKDPNITVLDYVVEQNLKNGVDDIYIYYDNGNQIFYNNKDERIHYDNIDGSDQEILYLSKYCVFNEGSKRQVGIYNYIYKRLRDEYEWVLFLDDDECIDKHVSFLNDYQNEHGVYIAWDNYISPSNNMNDQIKKEVYPYGAWFYKTAVNTNKTPMINTVHFGDVNGVTLNHQKIIKDNMFTNNYFVDNIWEHIKDSVNDSVHIHHVLYTSFENLITKIFDRKSILWAENKFSNMSLRIQLWYRLNDIPYSFDDLVSRLSNMKRQDIIEYISRNGQWFKHKFDSGLDARLTIRKQAD